MENERSFSVFLLLPFLDLIVTWSAKNFLCDKKHAKIKAPFFFSLTPLSYVLGVACLFINKYPWYTFNTLLIWDNHENTLMFHTDNLGLIFIWKSRPFPFLNIFCTVWRSCECVMDYLEIRIPFKAIKLQKRCQIVHKIVKNNIILNAIVFRI